MPYAAYASGKVRFSHQSMAHEGLKISRNDKLITLGSLLFVLSRPPSKAGRGAAFLKLAGADAEAMAGVE